MTQIVFSTGNPSKFASASDTCKQFGIELIQNTLEIDEIQGEEAEKIVRDKAEKAFQLVKEPVVVSDDSWLIAGLNGFPGAYMKSINHWFSVQDFVNLTAPLEDRRVHLMAYLAYKDEHEVKIFTRTYEGTLLKEPKGHSGPPSEKVISMAGDNGLSIAEIYDNPSNLHGRDVAGVWKDFAEWYSTKEA